MAQVRLKDRLKRFDQQYGRWVLPAVLLAMVLVDWLFPMHGSERLLEQHHPHQARVCIGMTASWSGGVTEVQRFYILLPFSFRHFTAVGVVRSSADGLAYFESPTLLVVYAIVLGLALIRFARRRDHVTTMPNSAPPQSDSLQ